MTKEQPTKAEFATFFDVVNHLANHENNSYVNTGLSIFPGLPRPIPEVVKVMGWIHSIINDPEEAKKEPAPLSVTGFEIPNISTPPVKRVAPKSKPKTKTEPEPIAASAIVVEKSKDERIPTPDELEATVLHPGPAFDYSEEVKGTVLIIPDDPTVTTNPPGYQNVSN